MVQERYCEASNLEYRRVPIRLVEHVINCCVWQWKQDRKFRLNKETCEYLVSRRRPSQILIIDSITIRKQAPLLKGKLLHAAIIYPAN